MQNRVEQADRMPFVTDYSKAYQKEKPQEVSQEVEMMKLEIERLKERNKQLELIRQMQPMEVKSTVSY